LTDHLLYWYTQAAALGMITPETPISNRLRTVTNCCNKQDLIVYVGLILVSILDLEVVTD